MLVQPLIKQSGSSVLLFTKLSIFLLYNLAITLLSVYLNKLKNPTVCLVIILFVTAKTWKQPSCPSVSEQIKSVEHPDNGMFHTD